MYAIAINGMVIIVVSLVMVAKPDVWGRFIVRFSRMPYMHPLEILVRLGFGLLFVRYAEDSKFPVTIKIMGYVLLAVGVGLMLTPPSQHRRFAIWSVEKFSKYFRPAGLVSLLFGVFLIYAAV